MINLRGVNLPKDDSTSASSILQFRFSPLDIPRVIVGNLGAPLMGSFEQESGDNPNIEEIHQNTQHESGNPLKDGLLQSPGICGAGWRPTYRGDVEELCTGCDDGGNPSVGSEFVSGHSYRCLYCIHELLHNTSQDIDFGDHNRVSSEDVV